MKEGSFDGLLSNFEFTGANLNVSHIKTPDQTPDALDLKSVPESVLRSGVIETLIQQNDDLLARLNVSLRRIALLEEKLNDSQAQSEQFRAKYENLKDQLLVMREQSRILAERTKESQARVQHDDSRFLKLQEELKFFEIRYAELYTNSTERDSRLRTQNEKLMRREMRLEKYREGVRRAAPILKAEVRQLRDKQTFYDAQISDLRNNLSESTQYITQQSKQHQKDLGDLTDNYESSIRDLQKEINDLTETERQLRLRADEADRLFQEKTQAENDLVIALRREEELKTQTATEIVDLQKALARYRNDSKELAFENERHTETIAQLRDETAQVKAENSALHEQVENLQHLWREQQTQVEKFNEQKVALQTLNQELSQSINQYRRDIRELKDKLEQATLEGKTPLKVSKKITVETAPLVAVETPEANPTTNKNETANAETNALMSKIDKVLSNIHFGR